MKFVPEVIGRSIAHNNLLLQRSSPRVLFGAGLVGMVGSTVLACRATLKMDEVLDEAKGKFETARTLDHPHYSELDRRRDVSLIYLQTGVKTAKLYAPAVILGSVSIVALTRSHNILTRRNVALTAAYGAIEKGFNEYRERVVEKYGEEQDRDFRYGTRDVEIVDPETGKTHTEKRVGLNGGSIYARFFDENCPSWNPVLEYNRVFLECQQNYANEMLHARGHVFLNEVYDMLGFERTKAGSVVGWLLTPDNNRTDNYIDFGIFNGEKVQVRDFVNGLEGAILLDFNVDGLIFDKLDFH